MPTTSTGKRYLDTSLAEIKRRSQAGEKVAVTFDVDNTLFDTRGRVLAIGKKFDKANGTTYFKGKTASKMGDTAKETSALVGMTQDHTRKFNSFWFKEFFDGANYKNDSQIKQTIALAKKAKDAGADVFYVTARAQSEESYTIQQLQKAGLPTNDVFVVSKPRMQDKTVPYKNQELQRIATQYDYVPWFVTESSADIAGIQALNTPVQSVLVSTKTSGTTPVASDTPVWKLKGR